MMERKDKELNKALTKNHRFIRGRLCGKVIEFFTEAVRES